MAFLVLVACGDSRTTIAGVAGTPPGSPAAALGSPAAPPGFPVTIENCGRTLTFDKPPSRAVLTYHPLVETFVGLGLGDRAIARALGRSGGDFYVLPLLEDQKAGIEKIPIVSTNYFPPPKEQMLALRADFLLAWGKSDTTEKGLASIDDLKAAGVQTYQVVCPGSDASESQSLSNTYNLILDLGKIFGVSDRAKARVAEVKARIAAVAEKTAGLPKVKVFAYYGGEGPLSVAGGKIVDAILEPAGAENVYSKDGLAYPEPSLEAAAGRTVDAFLVFADVQATRTGKLEDTKAADFLYHAFPNMPASRDRRSVFITEYYFSPGAWRHAEGVEAIARALHPEAFR